MRSFYNIDLHKIKTCLRIIERKAGYNMRKAITARCRGPRISSASASSNSLITDGILSKPSSGASLVHLGVLCKPTLGDIFVYTDTLQDFCGFPSLLLRPRWYPESPFPYFLNFSPIEKGL